MITFMRMVKSFMLKGFSQMVIIIVIIGFTISLMDKVNYGGRVNVFPLEIGFVAKQWGNVCLVCPQGQCMKVISRLDLWMEMVHILVSVGRPGPPPSLDLKPSTFDLQEKYWTRFTTEGSKITPPHLSCEFR